MQSLWHKFKHHAILNSLISDGYFSAAAKYPSVGTFLEKIYTVLKAKYSVTFKSTKKYKNYFLFLTLAENCSRTF